MPVIGKQVEKTNAIQLMGLWDALGMSQGQTVLCHSFLPSLGKLVPSADIVIDTILHTIGEDGTLIVPTFTYSHFRAEVFDARNSPSTVGILGDLVRKRPHAVRGTDPNFSMAAIGSRAEWLTRRDTINSLGENTPFDKLVQENACILLIGVDFTALPLFMHLEKIHQVDYRHDKRFSGQSINHGQIYSDESIHYVRDETKNPESFRSRAGEIIDQTPFCKKIKFRYGIHRFLQARTVVDVVSKGLADNPFFLIKQPV